MLVLIIVIFIIGCQNLSKPKNQDMSLPFTLRLNSITNSNYQLLQSEQNFEISVSAYRLYGKPNELLSSKIEIELPEGITLIDGKLKWQGYLNFYENDNIFVSKLKGNKEGLNQIKGKLYYLESGEFKQGDIKSFGACIGEDLNQAKIFCENYIPKTYVPQDGPGKMEETGYVACGCGCCRSENVTVTEKCLYRSNGDDINKVIKEDKKIAQSSSCAAAGCSAGVKYHYCD